MSVAPSQALQHLLIAALLGMWLVSPTLALSQTDPFDSITDEAAETLVRLLQQAEAAEQAQRWAEATAVYREMWALLPLDEYRFREALCLRELGEDSAAHDIFRSLTASPRSEVVSSAERELSRMDRERAIGEAQTRVSISVGASPTVAPPPPADSTLVERDDPGSSPWGPVVVSSGVAVLAGATVFGVLANERAADARTYDEAAPGSTADAVDLLNSDADRFATIANVGFAVGAGLVVAGVLTWILTGEDDLAPESIEPSVGDVTGVSVGWAF